MTFRINGTLHPPLREVTSRSAAPAGSTLANSGPYFDQVQFSGRLSGLEGRVQELTGQISQQIHARPTRSEIRSLQQQVENGTYQIDIDKIAARMLLHSEA